MFIQRIINVEAGTVEEKELGKSESEKILAQIETAKEIQKQQEARDLARQSALDKLAALGLTPAEISSITG
jgi:hypothetical protein